MFGMLDRLGCLATSCDGEKILKYCPFSTEDSRCGEYCALFHEDTGGYELCCGTGVRYYKEPDTDGEKIEVLTGGDQG